MRWRGLLAILVVSAAACGSSDAGRSTTTTTNTRVSSTTRPLIEAKIEATYTGAGPKVVMIGDSITALSRVELHRALTGFAVKIAGVQGEGLAGGPLSEALGNRGMLGTAKKYAADHPKVAVIALGTNDAWIPKISAADALRALREIVADFRGSCLVGMTVSETAVRKNYRHDEAIAINRALVAAVDQVVDWRRLSIPKRISDGIHPTPAGEVVLARAVDAAVKRCA